MLPRSDKGFFYFNTIKVMSNLFKVIFDDFEDLSKICQNKEISTKALGLYFKIMSLPDDCEFSMQMLISMVKEGKEFVYSAMKELKEHGYCEVKEIRKGGKIVGANYYFYSEPIHEHRQHTTDYSKFVVERKK